MRIWVTHRFSAFGDAENFIRQSSLPQETLLRPLFG